MAQLIINHLPAGAAARISLPTKHMTTAIPEKNYPQRTELQNRSLHLLFQLIADALNTAGLEKAVVLKGVECPWTKDSIKEDLWRPIQKAMLQKDSTTKLKTNEIDQVFDVLNRHLAKFGIHEDWPSIEEIMNKLRTGPY